MLNIIKEQWNKNREFLRKAIERDTVLNECGYDYIVKFAFENIYNRDLPDHVAPLNLSAIYEIDDGDYQGTILYIIPFNTYQPNEHEYLMTYVGYGSCSGCDTLQSIQDYSHGRPTGIQIPDFLELCKDILTNTIMPYNFGWRNDPLFDYAEELIMTPEEGEEIIND